MYSVLVRKLLEDLEGFLLLRKRQKEPKNLATWGEKEQLAKNFMFSSNNLEQQNILV